MSSEKDLFRETPVRFLGYANELGESFRAVIHKRWVWLSYGVASAYVVADACSKTYNTYKNFDKSSDKNKITKAALTGSDVLIWQTLASVVIPGFTINRICAGAKYLFYKSSLRKNAKWLTVGVGLASIPFIIKPIDNFVDYAMDETLRPIMGTERHGNAAAGIKDPD